MLSASGSHSFSFQSSTSSNCSVLGCPQCRFVCCSVNEMCRHMFDTAHGLAKCPACDTHIVGRAFRASLQRTIDAYKGRQSKSAASGSESDAATANDGGSGNNLMRSVVSIDIATHMHLPLYPNIHVFEKDAFKRPGAPEDYGLVPIAKTDAASLRNHSGSGVESECQGPFRCVDCQTVTPTWTQFTRHLDSTEHTLPRCVECKATLKCFGRMRPHKHEELTGHVGYWGLHYSKTDCSTRSQDGAYSQCTRFSGLSTTQYRCVCGVTFIHPVHLAAHLALTHHVSCIPAYATCRTCQVTLPLREMQAHILQPVGQSSQSQMDEIENTSSPEGGEETPVPHAEQALGHPGYRHDVCMEGFTAAPFMAWRPLMPTVAVSNGSGRSTPAAPVTTPPSKPFFVVAYQCRECLTLFSSWELASQHLHVTGHSCCYCAECANFFPPPSQASTASAPVSVTEYLAHLALHPNMLGPPPTPDVMEVLVDLSNQDYQGQWQTTKDSCGLSDSQQSILCYQCPAASQGCYCVFSYYGDLVDHFLETGHCSEHTAPMVQYRVQLLKEDLLKYFNFIECTYCSKPFHPSRVVLHEALCVERHLQISS